MDVTGTWKGSSTEKEGIAIFCGDNREIHLQSFTDFDYLAGLIKREKEKAYELGQQDLINQITRLVKK